MPAPLSNDLRERIIIKYQKGIKPPQIQAELEIKSLATVYQIIRLHDETGSWEPRPLNNGTPPKMTPQNMADLEAKIKECPDISLEELKEELNLPICISRICRIINEKFNLRRKKNSLSLKPKSH